MSIRITLSRSIGTTPRATIHSIISYYIKPGVSIITTEDHIMISDDLTHDKFAVKTFEELSLQHLKSKGITPNFIIMFLDNCKSHYKGKGTFQFHSQSKTPKMHNVFWCKTWKGSCGWSCWLSEACSLASYQISSSKLEISLSSVYLNLQTTRMGTLSRSFSI